MNTLKQIRRLISENNVKELILIRSELSKEHNSEEEELLSRCLLDEIYEYLEEVDSKIRTQIEKECEELDVETYWVAFDVEDFSIKVESRVSISDYSDEDTNSFKRTINIYSYFVYDMEMQILFSNYNIELWHAR